MPPSTSPFKLLIINPNTTKSMTESLKPVIDEVLSKHSASHVECTFFTAPSSPDHPGSIASINSPDDAEKSGEYCLPHLKPLIVSHDAFLVACYSEHPLVDMIQHEIKTSSRGPKFVTGIFEASVEACLDALASFQTVEGESSLFGIVTTGKIWEDALSSAVSRLDDDKKAANMFAGVETTGLTAVELHDLPEKLVRSRLSDAASRLVSRGDNKRKVRAICLGCAGMVGFDSAVREGVQRVLGKGSSQDVMIVDGIVAGIELILRRLQTR